MALFDQKAATYDEWCATPLGKFVDAIEKGAMKEVARPQEKESALDLGCGTGAFSYWLMYMEKGKKDKSSVFSRARLFTVDEIKKLGSHPPTEMQFALYVSMDEFENMDQAMLLEKQRKATYPEKRAGYVVAKWSKVG